jgi:putative hydrolase of the HAD superfamily
MKKPKMILFDYGQTLMDEKNFDGVTGTKAVLNRLLIIIVKTCKI